MKEKRAARRQEYQDRQRQEILDEALELFSERGYHNVSMQEIAAEAEFAVGTLYKLFANKEELYRAILFDLSEIFADALGQALEEGDGEVERITSYLRVAGEVFMANSRAIRLYFAETRGASFNIRAGLDDELIGRYDEILGWLAEVFATGIGKGVFRPLDPHILARSLDSLACTFLVAWLDDPERYPYEQSIAMIQEIFFRGVMAVKPVPPAAERSSS
ncbi:MAG: TetR/AcrR family transcriptional regulator [Deltaproteobacteria bacterium]|nr:TetR/AcrR family transcriptional regulator [Candidatus Anaeroferrophillus wilburensis]MBN2887983.1 TetR/AcrR family transcriptional regulator [Deltaproteobacteria bacterium]